MRKRLSKTVRSTISIPILRLYQCYCLFVYWFIGSFIACSCWQRFGNSQILVEDLRIMLFRNVNTDELNCSYFQNKMKRSINLRSSRNPWCELTLTEWHPFSLITTFHEVQNTGCVINKKLIQYFNKFEDDNLGYVFIGE